MMGRLARMFTPLRCTRYVGADKSVHTTPSGSIADACMAIKAEQKKNLL